MSTRKTTGKTKKKTKKDLEQDLSFEEALERLERLVSRLEEEDVPLEESLEAYAEGTRLVRHSLKRLEHAESVVRELATEDEAGQLEFLSSSEGAGNRDGDHDDEDEG